jgi:hypothetical protein
MRTRGEAAGSRRACGRSAAVFPAAAALLAILLLAVAGCGGSPGLGGLAGTWKLVKAGQPDPYMTLTVAPGRTGAEVTFTSEAAGGVSTAFDGVVQDGAIIIAVPADDVPTLASPTTRTGPPSPQPSAPMRSSRMQLSLGENGQLVVDRVLPDGTLEPMLVYERASASPSP